MPFFRDVIEAATGRRILKFDEASRRVVREINDWIDRNLTRLSQLVETNYVGRPNEFGNYLEPELIELIDRECPLDCRRPTTAKGMCRQWVTQMAGLLWRNKKK